MVVALVVARQHKTKKKKEKSKKGNPLGFEARIYDGMVKYSCFRKKKGPKSGTPLGSSGGGGGRKGEEKGKQKKDKGMVVCVCVCVCVCVSSVWSVRVASLASSTLD